MINLWWFGPFFLFLLRIVGRYSCVNKSAFQAQIRDIMLEVGQRPVIICANHLTMIDSMIITAFAFPMHTYMVKYRWFPWNVPELMNFGKNIPLRMMCYLGKCIYVERQGSISSKKLTWSKVKYMVQNGELVNIFPEGGRSRTGRVAPDQAVYGVGQIISEMKDCQVICLYSRGIDQENYAFFPKRGERFYLNARLIQTPTNETGRRAYREITMHIMNQLQSMEEEYFAVRERYR